MKRIIATNIKFKTIIVFDKNNMKQAKWSAKYNALGKSNLKFEKVPRVLIKIIKWRMEKYMICQNFNSNPDGHYTGSFGFYSNL